jgi:hypothetical protein
MRHEQIASDRISDQKLREIAVRLLEETGFVALTSILTAEETSHFHGCGECIGALANIARELSRDVPDRDVS